MRYPFFWDVMQCHMPEERLPNAFSCCQFRMIPIDIDIDIDILFMFHESTITINGI